ncbi:hypothetical protein GCM10009785_26960 [Brooklawnia cerclae]|uniref:DUF3152 domain-containing protein n=1 Tax=Brooklawnia cerclae TaxID=349934 RepID=A0ABX0SF34_9ACTN|nr:DUF3152 domain-containing protein [Brooklawnia cerclae]NIH57013.1 hypothetical protein [Brooklawnia cerclae]
MAFVVCWALTACSGTVSDDPDAPSSESSTAGSAVDTTVSPAGEPDAMSSSYAPGAPTPASTGADGVVRSGLTSTGVFATNTIAIPTTTANPDVRTYVVRVESSVPLDPDAVATQVQSILDDPRGWSSGERVAFSLVPGGSPADLVITIGSPPTVDQACGDLNAGGLWSCRVGNGVNLNSDRWFYATPTWSSESVDDYHVYLVNHEVGHYIGFGHVGCPAAGGLSPVMQQQSIDLGGCLPNGWPDVTGEAAQT